MAPRERFSARQAILIGQFVVNLPAVVIILGFLTGGIMLGGDNDTVTWMSLFIGFILGWLWWSFTLPRWRKWTLRRGTSPHQLQKLAVATFLTWPKDWILEKTEWKVDK